MADAELDNLGQTAHVIDVTPEMKRSVLEGQSMFAKKPKASETNSISKQFDEELQQQIDGTQEAGHIYTLGKPGDILLSTGFPYEDIELSASHLKEKSIDKNHPFELAEIKGLVNAIQDPIAVFSYGDKEKSQNAIVELTHNGKNFVVGVHFNQTRRGIEVSDIRGIFPKDNAEWLNWIAQDKALYLNKAEIQDLIDKQRINLAEVEYLDLDSIAKVIDNFENPKPNAGERFRMSDNEDNRFAKAPAERSLVGIHNIGASQLRKAIALGGLANPSTAVIDIDKQAFDKYGEISLLMPSSLVDARTGRHPGTAAADLYSPNYPTVHTMFSSKDRRALQDWITEKVGDPNKANKLGLFYTLEDNLERGNDPVGLEYIFVKEKGAKNIDAYEHDGFVLWDRQVHFV